MELEPQSHVAGPRLKSRFIQMLIVERENTDRSSAGHVSQTTQSWDGGSWNGDAARSSADSDDNQPCFLNVSSTKPLFNTTCKNTKSSDLDDPEGTQNSTWTWTVTWYNFTSTYREIRITPHFGRLAPYCICDLVHMF
jgi:hypothetical protein